MGKGEAVLLRQPLSPKGMYVSTPREDNRCLGDQGPSYHTQVGKNQARATSRATEIKVGEYPADPRLISPTLLAAWSFRRRSVVWTLITDEGYLSHVKAEAPRPAACRCGCCDSPDA